MVITKAATTVHRLPVNLSADDIADYEGEATYTTFDSLLKPLNRVWVSPDSVVYKNGSLLRETLAAKEHSKYYRLRHLAKKILVGRKVNLDDKKKYLLVTDSWSAGHFHWFCDVLPKLASISEQASDFSLLLQDTAYTRNIAEESLQRLGIVFRDIIWMDEGSFYNVKNLSYLSKITKSGQMYKPLMKQLQEKLTSGISSGNDRVYISREQARFRKVVNEDKLQPVLKQYGFETVYTDKLSLTEQVNIFSKASVVCGIHGAGLVNCIFMQPGGKLVELRKKENGCSNVGYWHFADSLDHAYYYYNGTPDSDLPLVGRGCNLRIDAGEFEQKVLQVL